MEQPQPLLKDYTLRERQAYIGTIASIATVDREASQEEITFINALADAAELDDNAKQSVLAAAKDTMNLDLKQNLDILKSSDLKFALVTDIIAFAKSDNKFTPEEEQRIKEIAAYLGISQEQFNVLGRFVEESSKSANEGQDVSSQDFFSRTGLASGFRNAGIPMGGLMKGLLGILAPLAIAGMFRRRGMGGFGGGGLLGSLLGGGYRSGFGGGFGSIFSMLSGRRGYGGMGSVLGSLLGGGRRSMW